MSDNADSAALLPFNLEQLRTLLDKLDAVLAEGRVLREKIVRTMLERRDAPMWPDDPPSRTPR